MKKQQTKYPKSLIEASQNWTNYSFHYYIQSQQPKRLSYNKTKVW